MSDIYNITAEHPDDCDCAHCYDPVRRVADLQTQRDTLARALLESQAALAKFQAEQRAERALNQASRDSIDRLFAEYDAKLATSQAALAAANARADAAEETGDAAERDADHYQSERDALELRCDGLVKELDGFRADLARVTAERDEARTKVTSLHAQLQTMNPIVSAAVDRAEKAESEASTLRESVRELVDGLATAKDSMLDGAAAVQRLILLHGSSAKAETLAARMRTKASEIDALLAKHAAPAPTPADTKEDDRG